MGSFNYTEILASLSQEMAAMDQILAEILNSKHPYLQKLHQHILTSPGKRLRPALLFLCSKMLEYTGSNHITYAAVFELIHTATLVHDDVIDGSETRRGDETLNHSEGTILSVLFGDLLYTKANTLAISAGSLEVMGLISSVTEEMIEGELLQEKHAFNVDISEDEYFRILSRKTAFLFGGTAKTAALAAGQGPENCEAMYQYGFNLGISFQLIDDFLDYTGQQNQMGKPVLSDLLAGKLTLPVIRYLQETGEDTRSAIRSIWEHRDLTAMNGLAENIRSSATFEQTRELSREYANRAIQHLAPFSENATKSLLQRIPIELLNRKA